MRYYIELVGEEVVMMHEVDFEMNETETRKEISKELAEKITRLPATVTFDDGSNVADIIPAPEPVPSEEEINEQVVEKIREQYTENDEFKMLRLGSQNSEDPKYLDYLQYVNECILWGDEEKSKLGYL